MPKQRIKENDIIALKLWEKAYINPVELDFSNDKQGKFMAQNLWKLLDNYRKYISENKLHSFYFRLYQKMLKVELILEKSKVVLRRKSENNVQKYHRIWVNRINTITQINKLSNKL